MLTPFPRKLYRLFLWLIALILLFINSYLIAGRTLGRIVVNGDFVSSRDENSVAIYIISNGIHTDIAVPTKTSQIDWTQPFPPQTFNPPQENPAYISFGWGEQMLYEEVPTWDKLTTSIFVNAMLLPSKSSMHITYWKRPLLPTTHVKKVLISPQQYDALILFIQSSIAWDENGRPLSQDCCWYPAVSDNFYDSPPRYHLFQTCNHWTVQALKETGLPAPLWTPFPENIIDHLDAISE